MSHTIAGVTILDDNMHVGLESKTSPYYMQQTEVELVDGVFHAYVNEFGVESLPEVEQLREVYSTRSMGVELYGVDAEIIWQRPVLLSW